VSDVAGYTVSLHSVKEIGRLLQNQAHRVTSFGRLALSTNVVTFRTSRSVDVRFGRNHCRYRKDLYLKRMMPLLFDISTRPRLS
jgi:hypothetical protein